MTRIQLDLLRSRRSLSLFITQALGAFNANRFKSAIPGCCPAPRSGP